MSASKIGPATVTARDASIGSERRGVQGSGPQPIGRAVRATPFPILLKRGMMRIRVRKWYMSGVYLV